MSPYTNARPIVGKMLLGVTLGFAIAFLGPSTFNSTKIPSSVLVASMHSSCLQKNSTQECYDCCANSTLPYSEDYDACAADCFNLSNLDKDENQNCSGNCTECCNEQCENSQNGQCLLLCMMSALNCTDTNTSSPSPSPSPAPSEGCTTQPACSAYQSIANGEICAGTVECCNNGSVITSDQSCANYPGCPENGYCPSSCTSEPACDALDAIDPGLSCEGTTPCCSGDVVIDYDNFCDGAGCPAGGICPDGNGNGGVQPPVECNGENTVSDGNVCLCTQGADACQGSNYAGEYICCAPGACQQAQNGSYYCGTTPGPASPSPSPSPSATTTVISTGPASGPPNGPNSPPTSPPPSSTNNSSSGQSSSSQNACEEGCFPLASCTECQTTSCTQAMKCSKTGKVCSNTSPCAFLQGTCRGPSTAFMRCEANSPAAPGTGGLGAGDGAANGGCTALGATCQYARQDCEPIEPAASCCCQSTTTPPPSPPSNSSPPPPPSTTPTSPPSPAPSTPTSSQSSAAASSQASSSPDTPPPPPSPSQSTPSPPPPSPSPSPAPSAAAASPFAPPSTPVTAPPPVAPVPPVTAPPPSAPVPAPNNPAPRGIPECGDGFINQATEQCDDGNRVNSDGCSSTCRVENNRRVTTNPNTPFCGDGFINQGLEQCDDGNTRNNDGCSRVCGIESRAVAFAGICGDGVLHLNETCDDGNTFGGDGCSSTCQSEYRPAAQYPQNPFNPYFQPSQIAGVQTYPTGNNPLVAGDQILAFQQIQQLLQQQSLNPFAVQVAQYGNQPNAWNPQPATRNPQLATLYAVQGKGPVGDTGPAAVFAIAAGAAGGIGYVRRKRRC